VIFLKLLTILTINTLSFSLKQDQSKMAKYVVLGATGQTGAATTAALVERATVRVAVRSEDKGAAWKKRGAEVAVVEDVADVDALTRAFEGVTGAYVLNPPDYKSNDMFARAEKVASTIIEAARRARLPKIVALSSIGAHLLRGTRQHSDRPHLEETLKSLQAEAAVGFVRAAGFMENWKALLPVAQQQASCRLFTLPWSVPCRWSPRSTLGRRARMSCCKSGKAHRCGNCTALKM
jgi:uncharacterized protein YbjT (DUF2867 family)